MNEGYVDLRGVRTWYGEVRHGPPLMMLHPGGVDSRMFAPNVAALAPHFHVWLPERRGHGRTPDVDGPYTYEAGARRHDSLSREVRRRPGADGFLVEKPDLCNALLLDFLSRDPVRTFAPIRRA